MRLEGSCHCGAVRFAVESPHPYPFNLCYCSICRKTQGGGGWSINLSGRSDTLEVAGEPRVYQARLTDPETGAETRSSARRHFCGECGSHVWLFDPRWPELVHPVASAVDTPLPVPPDRYHIMLDSKAPWVRVHADPSDRMFPDYPDESIAEWHQWRELESDETPSGSVR